MESRKLYWQKHIEGPAESGLSKTAYCQRHGLSVKSLYRWEKKLSNEGILTAEDHHGRPAFVAIQLEDKPVASPTYPYVIKLGSIVQIEMSALPSSSWLFELWQSLEGAR